MKTVKHESKEANLQAAKRAVRSNQRAYLMHRTVPDADIIDIITGRDIIERHICRTTGPDMTFKGTRPFCVEELALYQ